MENKHIFRRPGEGGRILNSAYSEQMCIVACDAEPGPVMGVIFCFSNDEVVGEVYDVIQGIDDNPEQEEVEEIIQVRYRRKGENFELLVFIGIRAPEYSWSIIGQELFYPKTFSEFLERIKKEPLWLILGHNDKGTLRMFMDHYWQVDDVGEGWINPEDLRG